jgi:hypothetical protein
MEIKDNDLLRHFETMTSHGLLIMEYALQDRKIFLTKLNSTEEMAPELLEEFITMVLKQIEEQKLKVVPTHPKIVRFFRKNPRFKELLPPGIKI